MSGGLLLWEHIRGRDRPTVLDTELRSVVWLSLVVGGYRFHYFTKRTLI